VGNIEQDFIYKYIQVYRSKNEDTSLYNFLASTLESCNDWELTELYAQKIEGSSKLLYQYDAWGGRDSHLFGYSILDSTETFKINKVQPLLFSELLAIPNSKQIFGVTSDQSDYTKTTKESYKPLHTEIRTIDGIEIKINTYQYKGYSNRTGRLESYEFASFKETRDSLFFYNLNDVESINHPHLDTLKMRKSNVFIQQDQYKEIIQIIIEDLNFSEDGEIIYIHNYFLKPKNKIKSSDFSNYGIFKEINISSK